MSTYIYNSSGEKVLLSGTDTVDELLAFLKQEGLDHFLTRDTEGSLDYFVTPEFEEKVEDLVSKAQVDGNEEVAESLKRINKKLLENGDSQSETIREIKFK